MRKLLILAVVALSSCSTYRIEIHHSSAGTFYTPAKRHGFDWDNHFYSYTTKLGAVNKIYEWHTEKELQKQIKTRYIYFK